MRGAAIGMVDDERCDEGTRCCCATRQSTSCCAALASRFDGDARHSARKRRERRGEEKRLPNVVMDMISNGDDNGGDGDVPVTAVMAVMIDTRALSMFEITSSRPALASSLGLSAIFTESPSFFRARLQRRDEKPHAGHADTTLVQSTRYTRGTPGAPSASPRFLAAGA